MKYEKIDINKVLEWAKEFNQSEAVAFQVFYTIRNEQKNQEKTLKWHMSDISDSFQNTLLDTILEVTADKCMKVAELSNSFINGIYFTGRGKRRTVTYKKLIRWLGVYKREDFTQQITDETYANFLHLLELILKQKAFLTQKKVMDMIKNEK